MMGVLDTPAPASCANDCSGTMTGGALLLLGMTFTSVKTKSTRCRRSASTAPAISIPRAVLAAPPSKLLGTRDTPEHADRDVGTVAAGHVEEGRPDHVVGEVQTILIEADDFLELAAEKTRRAGRYWFSQIRMRFFRPRWIDDRASPSSTAEQHTKALSMYRHIERLARYGPSMLRCFVDLRSRSRAKEHAV